MKLHKLILLLLAILIVEFACGQIQLLNPSFEGGGDGGICGSGVCPIGWNMCEFGVCNCVIDSYVPKLIPDTAFDGKSVACILVSGNTYNGSFSQKLQCTLNANYLYHFQAAFSLIWADIVPGFYKPGPISIFAGNDTCDLAEMIYLSPILDTFWKVYDITFITQHTNSTIIFRGVPNNNGQNYNVAIDALSPIAVVNAHQVHAGVSDTVFVKGTTACVNLSAEVDTAMGSVWWEQVGAGTISNQLHAGVFCTDTNTTYIVHTLTRDSTCAGYLLSSDTVRVRFVEANSITQQEQVGIRFYPNPANEVLFVETDAPATFFFIQQLRPVSANQSGNKG